MIKLRAKRGRTSKQLPPLSCVPDPKSSFLVIESAVKVASNEDLLIQILLHVPLKALTSFKSVSKHWLALITNPHFVRLHNTLSPSPSASSFFFRLPCPWRSTPEYQFIPLDVGGECPTPFKTLDFVPEPYTRTAYVLQDFNLVPETYVETTIYVVQSVNGLLLCFNYGAPEVGKVYYVYNPTTKEFATLPLIRLEQLNDVCSMSLAFDPAKSPYYKVVCVGRSAMFHQKSQIAIYSSKTRLWRVSGQPFIPPEFSLISECVYWNGSLHWWDSYYDQTLWDNEPYALYFKVDEEILEKLPMPKSKNHNDTDYWQKLEGGCLCAGCADYSYFGESADNLHFVSVNPDFLLNVYEMTRDYSGWFVKYQVDLSAIPKKFPEIKRYNKYCAHAFAILSLVWRGKEEKAGSFVILQIRYKIVRYNLVDKSVEMLYELSPTGYLNDEYDLNSVLLLPYIESLASV